MSREFDNMMGPAVALLDGVDRKILPLGGKECDFCRGQKRSPGVGVRSPGGGVIGVDGHST